MSSARTESVEDRDGLLSQPDHMRDMDRIEMEVVALHRPFASVTRVTGRIAPQDPAAWQPANQAVRIEVEQAEGLRPVSRIYTVRSFDPATCLLEIDFVMHEDDSPAMRWLRAAQAGDRVWMIGPRQHFVPNHAPGRRAAILADETAIPAVHAILNDWPAGAPGELWIETRDAAAAAELHLPAGVTLNLLLLDSPAAAGSTGRLVAAAKSVLQDRAGWTIWAAGERQEMRDLRDHARALGCPRGDVRVFGYWKKGMSSSEIDRIRLAEYGKLRARGDRMESLSDADLPI